MQHRTVEQIVPERAKEIVDKPLADCRKEKHKEETEGGMKDACVKSASATGFKHLTYSAVGVVTSKIRHPAQQELMSAVTSPILVGGPPSWTRSSRLQETRREKQSNVKRCLMYLRTWIHFNRFPRCSWDRVRSGTCDRAGSRNIEQTT